MDSQSLAAHHPFSSTWPLSILFLISLIALYPFFIGLVALYPFFHQLGRSQSFFHRLNCSLSFFHWLDLCFRPCQQPSPALRLSRLSCRYFTYELQISNTLSHWSGPPNKSNALPTVTFRRLFPSCLSSCRSS